VSVISLFVGCDFFFFLLFFTFSSNFSFRFCLFVWMGNLFGKTLTPKEMLRESQAMLRKGIRELEREREKMQREEKKLQIEMKALAKKGQMGAARIMAKDLIRTRNAISKFHAMKAQLQAVSIRIQTMSSTAAMADSMKGAAKAM
jgi:charged multivesicular body protein 2A